MEKYLSYQEAKEFVSKLDIKTTKQWEDYVKSGNKPDNIPSNLSRKYKNQGWVSMGEFLGTGNVHVRFREYLPYEEAKEFVSKLGIKNLKEWYQYCKSGNKPDNIPVNINRTYKKSIGDFLGTNFIAAYNRKYLSYQEAKKFVFKLGLKNQKEWKEYAKSRNKPDDIPNDPFGVYKRNNQWISWGDFLGNNNIATFNREYVSFEEARKFVVKLGLKGKQEWLEYVKSGKKPDYIPAKPEHVYKLKK
jgi:DNA-directed RNA polymerase subunit F